jgi:hypothetical protein
MVAPVTSAPSADGGSPSASFSHRNAASSKQAMAGELTKLKQF